MPDDTRNLTPRQRTAIGVLTVLVGAGAALAPFEGRIRHWYADPVLGWRVPTVCDGHTGGVVDRSRTFTDAECDQLRNADLRKTYEGILTCIGDVPMPDHELEADLSLAYNIGPEEFCNSSIPRKLKAGDHQAACATISAYRFVGGRDCAVAANNCAGIVHRRAAERQLCEVGT